jgi:hypothetical protein
MTDVAEPELLKIEINGREERWPARLTLDGTEQYADWWGVFRAPIEHLAELEALYGSCVPAKVFLIPGVVLTGSAIVKGVTQSHGHTYVTLQCANGLELEAGQLDTPHAS